jgi:putative membrane protein
MQVSWMWLWVAVMMVIWLTLILSVGWLMNTRPGRGPTVPSQRAREILADRYARGEFDYDEYQAWLGRRPEVGSRR